MLWVWFVGTLTIGAFTTGVHALALPSPAAGDLTGSEVTNLPGPAGGAIHVLYASCKCSERIVDALVARRARPNLDEIVLGVGDFGNRASALRAAGYQLIGVSAEELTSRFRIEAAPLLLVVRPDRSVGYAGGYRSTESGPVDDARLIAEALERKSTEAYPLFGCAVSAALRRIVDPFGFKR